MYSKTIIIGHAGRDAEQRFTPTGKAVTQFSVAVNIGYGENKKTHWFDVTAWDSLAEVCAKYVKKGMLVACDGLVELNEYQGKDGTTKASLRLTAREVKFLSKAEGSEQASSGMGAPDDFDGVPF